MGMASGALGEGMYAVPAPNEPGWVIVRRKPGSHGKRWKMHPEQEKGTIALSNEVKKASAIYNEDKEKWRLEFEQWKKKQKKYTGKTPYQLNGSHCTNPWEYCRIILKSQS